jgi:hypothetical protein
MNVRWFAAFRDTAIIWLLTFFGGFIIGMAGAGGNEDQVAAALVVSNLVLGSIGFTLSACLARSQRFEHLVMVGLLTWLISLPNVFLFEMMTLSQWFFSSLFVAFIMFAGLGLSYVFVRTPAGEHPSRARRPSPTYPPQAAGWSREASGTAPPATGTGRGSGQERVIETARDIPEHQTAPQPLPEVYDGPAPSAKPTRLR